MGKTAKVFMTGRSQAVRLPKEFRFTGAEVEIRRDPVSGGVLLFEQPKQTQGWDAFLKLRAELGDLDDFLFERNDEKDDFRDPFR